VPGGCAACRKCRKKVESRKRAAERSEREILEQLAGYLWRAREDVEGGLGGVGEGEADA
jgi:hypothetical protein